MSLGVLLDGVALSEGEARAFWGRFSAWMEAHAGDLGGFARAEGLASVHPQIGASGPVLVASRTAPQGPYVTAPTKPSAAPKREGRTERPGASGERGKQRPAQGNGPPRGGGRRGPGGPRTKGR